MAFGKSPGQSCKCRKFERVKRNTMVACSVLAALALTSGCGGAVAGKPAAVGSPLTSYRWPLTGKVAPSAPAQVALSVKIDNAPAGRPQSGLDQIGRASCRE